MDYPIIDQITQICKRHYQPILCYEQFNNQPNCLSCLLEKTGMIPAEKYQQKLKEIINKEKQNYINNRQLYIDIYNSILNCKNSLVWSFDKILQIIQEYLKMIDSNQYKILQQTEQNLYDGIIEDFEKQIQEQQLSNEQFKNQIEQLLDKLQKNYLNTEQLMKNCVTKPKLATEEQILDWIKVECCIIKQSSQLTSQYDCREFAFNKENTILVVACGKEIIVYEFINGVITQELQRLTDHTGSVSSLYFMQQTNSFLSGSSDKSIIIWEFDDSKNKWFAHQKLQEHIYQVRCILMNSNEDQLISGSEDKTIKFWKKSNNNWSCLQTVHTKEYMAAIDLSETEDKLILHGFKKFLLVMEKGSDDLWRIVQIIHTSLRVSRLCFTNKDQFIFKPDYGDYLGIFRYDKGKKIFQNIQTIYLNQQKVGYISLLCQYIKQFKMIVIQNGKYLNIFKINQTGDYHFIQSIELQQKFFGRMSHNGQYLVTWDIESKVFQVRKFKILQ